VYASRTGNPNWYLQAPSGSAALGLQTGPITVNSVCPKGLARDCPLGYDYFTDVNSEGLFMIRWLISTILSGKFVHFSSTRTEYVQEIRSDSRWVLQSWRNGSLQYYLGLYRHLDCHVLLSFVPLDISLLF
jgi:hypothetical protein